MLANKVHCKGFIARCIVYIFVAGNSGKSGRKGFIGRLFGDGKAATGDKGDEADADAFKNFSFAKEDVVDSLTSPAAAAAGGAAQGTGEQAGAAVSVAVTDV